MGVVEVHDGVLWARHIAGDRELCRRIEAMKPEEEIELEIDGRRGWWCKMADGKDGRVTQGLRAASLSTRKWWQDHFKHRKGLALSIREVVAE